MQKSVADGEELRRATGRTMIMIMGIEGGARVRNIWSNIGGRQIVVVPRSSCVSSYLEELTATNWDGGAQRVLAGWPDG